MFIRATVVIAVKYSIVERPEKIDEIIYPEISSFLMLIKDHDRVSSHLTFIVVCMGLWEGGVVVGYCGRFDFMITDLLWICSTLGVQLCWL